VRLRFGRYAGMTTEVLLLCAPDYADWVLAHRPGSVLANALLPLAAAFDARPYTQPCACGGLAAKALAYRNSAELILLCAGCAALLPRNRVLDQVDSYRAALDHVSRTCVRQVRRRQRRLVRVIGLAKGMPLRVTERAAAAFLGGP
jgi:hypothetical protein